MDGQYLDIGSPRFSVPGYPVDAPVGRVGLQVAQEKTSLSERSYRSLRRGQAERSYRKWRRDEGPRNEEPTAMSVRPAPISLSPLLSVFFGIAVLM